MKALLAVVVALTTIGTSALAVAWKYETETDQMTGSTVKHAARRDSDCSLGSLSGTVCT
jgi:hypothetical protein